MNIFAIEGNEKTGEIDWILSGKSHDNYRVVKMILESCQLLSTALNVHGLSGPYKSFNPKHPSTMWTIESSANFENLVELAVSLIEEYELRFKKQHKCKEVLKTIIKKYEKNAFPTDKPTPLRLAMPNDFKTNNPVLSYRNYWVSKPNVRYPEHKVPQWFKERRVIPYQIIV